MEDETIIDLYFARRDHKQVNSQRIQQSCADDTRAVQKCLL